MHKILQDKMSKEQIKIYDEHHKELVKLAETKDIKLKSLKAAISVTNEGWQAFENGKLLISNPFVQDVVNTGCDFNWWKLGYEMAQQETSNREIKNR